MEFFQNLIFHLLIISFSEGLKISSKLNFDGEQKISEFVNHDNQTDHGKKYIAEPEGRSRNLEAKIPLVLKKKNDGYEVKIPLTVEEEKVAGPENKMKFFSGIDLFQRSSDKPNEITTTKAVPIVKGSLFHIKPDFLVPIPYERRTTVHAKDVFTFENFWPSHVYHDKKNKIEGLNPPVPVTKEWVLNTTPFLLFPINTTARPSISATIYSNKSRDQSFWNALEGSTWTPWNQNRKSHWTLSNPEWSDSRRNYQNNYPNYHTRNVRYPVSHAMPWNNFNQGFGGKFPGGRWISCPPFEVNDGGSTSRQIVPGCPQNAAKPSDVEFINVTPVSVVDDKTSFKDFVGKPETPSEEPKIGE